MVSAINSTGSETYRRKRRKHLEAAKIVESEDRISCLPSEVLCHILSFLPTKYAVGTSILSTRWKYLWASVSNYDFDDELLFLPSKHSGAKKCHFSNFVDRVLMLQRASSMKKFCLNCTQEYDSSRVNMWISSAIVHGVEELEICLSMENSLALPRNLFDCKTLVTLKLSFNLDIGAPFVICFPNLKTLHLRSLDCLDDNSMKKIISGCPILEELSIKRYVPDKIQNICVQSSTLRRLVLYFCIAWPKDHKYGIVIEAPCLEFLDIGDYISEDFNVNELSQLSEACLSLGQIYKQSISSDKYGENLIVNLLSKLSKVRRLKLSHHIGGSVSCALAAGSCLCIYRNLTYLEVEVEGSWLFVSELLEIAPNLEVLICTKVRRCSLIIKGPNVPRCCTWKPPDSVPSCISSRLGSIQLTGFDGCQVQMKLVRYILKSAKFLQELKITSHKLDLKLQSNILKELLLFPRGSTTCQIEFS